MSDAEKLVALQCEVQLLRWSDSSTNGRTVTFQLPSDEDTHPMRDYAIKSGKNSGHRFLMVLVEIDEQEQPVKQVARSSQVAAVLCKDPLFWTWAGERSICDIKSEEDARQWLLNGAGIESRKQFDTNRQANDWLMWQVVEPYREYQEALGRRALGGKA